MIDAKLYMVDAFYYGTVNFLIKAIMRYEETPREKERERSNELLINNTIESLCELRSKLAMEHYDKITCFSGNLANQIRHSNECVNFFKPIENPSQYIGPFPTNNL